MQLSQRFDGRLCPGNGKYQPVRESCDADDGVRSSRLVYKFRKKAFPESLSPQWVYSCVELRSCLPTGGIVIWDSGSGNRWTLRVRFFTGNMHYTLVDNVFWTRAVRNATCEGVCGVSETLEARTKSRKACSLKILSRGSSAYAETAYVFPSGPTGKGMDGSVPGCVGLNADSAYTCRRC